MQTMPLTGREETQAGATGENSVNPNARAAMLKISTSSRSSQTGGSPPHSRMARMPRAGPARQASLAFMCYFHRQGVSGGATDRYLPNVWRVGGVYAAIA